MSLSKSEMEELFGEDSEDDENDLKNTPCPATTATTVPEIDGLSIAYGALSPDLQTSLLTHIFNEKWFDPSKARDQVMRFGTLPPCLQPLSDLGASLLPDNLSSRSPVFDQMIANYYTPGQGLAHHVDLVNRFEDGIVVASITGTCIMEFRPAAHMRNGKENNDVTIPFLLSPGDVVSLSGPARWDWEHGIPCSTEDVWGSQTISRAPCRVSITLRKLSPEAGILKDLAT
ncbi:hypothetical protein HDV00_003851 [Rhizophlyctis rosea]|nr:hypothetical protein HDV00_003851 [Rhizophlyctis rosea]